MQNQSLTKWGIFLFSDGGYSRKTYKIKVLVAYLKVVSDMMEDFLETETKFLILQRIEKGKALCYYFCKGLQNNSVGG